MNKLIKSFILWAAVIFLLPRAAAGKSMNTAEPASVGTVEVQKFSLASDKLAIETENGDIRHVSVEEYAIYAVLAEIPYVLDEEALKAQVCAARTYAARRIAMGESISDDSSRHQICFTEEQARLVYGDGFEDAFAAVSEAARATEGMIIMYGGYPITAAFHVSSVGMTESAENVWGKSLPYLVPVQTSDSSEFNSKQHVFTYKEISARIRADFPDATDFSGIEITEKTQSGTVISARLCGTELSGAQLAHILSFDSCAFTAECDGERVIFSVNGCGHLAGMSICGADEMSRQGRSCEEILAHYYKDTKTGSITFEQ